MYSFGNKIKMCTSSVKIGLTIDFIVYIIDEDVYFIGKKTLILRTYLVKST